MILAFAGARVGSSLVSSGHSGGGRQFCGGAPAESAVGVCRKMLHFVMNPAMTRRAGLVFGGAYSGAPAESAVCTPSAAFANRAGA